ncbi:hypothetical protein ANCCAN_20291 [Ancylostoma caninum]|uniref:BRCT domain-containing protein n=1 Tax=Ancylostoma caninum TaxID=29170 RepID=A0A368FSU1_ANCCA|nr:hypothetical protein ANCCAN_20291 [Ancylostoma caninum]
MSGRARSSGSDAGSRQKRKRVGFADTPTQLKSPCNKAARSDFFNVFLVGFSEKEKADIIRNCADEIDVKEVLSTSVTHLVVKLPTRKDKPYPYAALYYAVVSGAWILRPSWLALSKDGVVPECDHEFRNHHIDIQTPLLAKFRDIIKLCENYQKLRDREGCKIFSDSVFRRVFILANRTCEGRQKKAMLRSLIHAGGGSIAVDDSWRTIRERPSKAADLVSTIIIENGEDLSSHEININFIKQLLMRGVPVLYEEILSQLLHNQVVPNLEIMMTHAVYYWCNEHHERLRLSEEDLECVRKIHLKNADRNDNRGAGDSGARSTSQSMNENLNDKPDGSQCGVYDASEGDNRCSSC